jgi:hypothetical protein
MNAGRRMRQKNNRAQYHGHLNREERTNPETGEVERCLFCRPVRNDNEQSHVHGNQVFRRPVQGMLRWADKARTVITRDLPQTDAEPQAVKNLRQVTETQDALSSVDVKAAVRKIEKQGSKRGG